MQFDLNSDVQFSSIKIKAAMVPTLRKHTVRLTSTRLVSTLVRLAAVSSVPSSSVLVIVTLVPTLIVLVLVHDSLVLVSAPPTLVLTPFAPLSPQGKVVLLPEDALIFPTFFDIRSSSLLVLLTRT